MLNQINSAINELEQGNAMASADSLFGQPVSEDSSNDFGVTQAMASWYADTGGILGGSGSGGGCG